MKHSSKKRKNDVPKATRGPDPVTPPPNPPLTSSEPRVSQWFEMAPRNLTADAPTFTVAELAAILPAKYASVLNGLQQVGAGASPELLLGALENANDEIVDILARYQEGY